MDSSRKVGRVGAQGVRSSEATGELEPGVEQVGGEDSQAAQGEELGEHQTNGPLPCHHHEIAGQHGEAVDAFEDGVDGFEQRAFDERVLRRDFHDAWQAEGHDAHIFRVAAARWLEAGGDAGALVLRALREGSVAAGVAGHARDVMVQGHAFAEAEAAHARADLHDGAGGLVAEDARWRDGAVLDFLYVRRADAAHGHAHEQFVRADARHGDSLEAEVVGTAIDDGAHRFGNRQHGGSCSGARGDLRMASCEGVIFQPARGVRLTGPMAIRNSPVAISSQVPMGFGK